MPDGRELKMLLRPLLSRRSDLAYTRRAICFVPFTRYLRGVAFMAYHWSPYSDVKGFSNQLCTGCLSEDIRGEPLFRVTNHWKDNPKAISRELCEELEHRILPMMESIANVDEHRKWRYSYGLPDEDFDLACDACIRGDFDAAEALMTALIETEPFLPGVPRSVTEEHRVSGWQTDRMAYLLMTLRTDRSQVLPLLHEWEALSVKGCKAEKYWKPSPFPCEL
jgi:hypothetical protein